MRQNCPWPALQATISSTHPPSVHMTSNPPNVTPSQLQKSSL